MMKSRCDNFHTASKEISLRSLPYILAFFLVTQTTLQAIGWEIRVGADQNSGRNYAVVGQKAMNQDAFLAFECQPSGLIVGIGTNVPYPTDRIIDDQKVEIRIRTSKPIKVTVSAEPTSGGALNFTTRRKPGSAKLIFNYIMENRGDMVVNVGDAPTLIFEDADRIEKISAWERVCQLGGMRIRK